MSKEQSFSSKGDMPMDCVDAAYEILKRSEWPRHYTELTKEMLSSGLWSPDGDTPEQTVNARINEEITQDESKARFCRVGRGIYSIATPSTRLLARLQNNSCGIEVRGAWTDSSLFTERTIVDLDATLACVIAAWRFLSSDEKNKMVDTIKESLKKTRE
jgi:hypothetical protein